MFSYINFIVFPLRLVPTTTKRFLVCVSSKNNSASGGGLQKLPHARITLRNAFSSSLLESITWSADFNNYLIWKS